ncbi:hypothetical protein CC2G_011079 [Coprinopsis cinerea AmutBmut pab1-1]|nr:hypothetical protein CC2G_011079 [Coprinopsis cinerea AmutBmut pab1-1]
MVQEAREKIFGQGLAVKTGDVEKLLKPESYIPVVNAFSKLSKPPISFDVFSSLVVDLLHEFELGTWKDLFLQLIRLLVSFQSMDKNSASGSLVTELDYRYRCTPSFGDQIRKFSANASETKRKAARDFEDLLQCAIPAFDSLAPEPHNAIIMKLLYLAATWHALAKLRLHSDYTLKLLDSTTSEMAAQFRLFLQETCAKVKTFELQREAEARNRREARKKAKMEARQSGPQSSTHGSHQNVDCAQSQGERMPHAPILQATTSTGSDPSAGPGLASTQNAVNSIVRPARPGTKRKRTTEAPQVHASGQGAPGILAHAITQGTDIDSNPQLDSDGHRPSKKRREGSKPSLTVPVQDSNSSFHAAGRSPPGPVSTESTTTANSLKAVQFTLKTYKYHALADYTEHIRRFGTTDSYTSEVCEFQHGDPKGWYQRTDKRNYRNQIAKIERRRARIRKIRHKLEAELGIKVTQSLQAVVTAKSAATISPNVHHHIGSNQNEPVHLLNVTTTAKKANTDISSSINRWVPLLKSYLLPRILTALKAKAEDPTDWLSVIIQNDCIYHHKLMKLRYTSYDMRRQEDVIHVHKSKPCNIMVLNPDYDPADTSSRAHPFRYGRVLGIFHGNVNFIGPLIEGGRSAGYHRIDFLWIHWYRVQDNNLPHTLDEVELLPAQEKGSISFIHPSEVIRAVHLIPRFSKGVRSETRSDGRQPRNVKVKRDWKEWTTYYVNRFVDRDMFMRYLWGMAPGHAYTHGFTPPTDASDRVPPEGFSPSRPSTPTVSTGPAPDAAAPDEPSLRAVSGDAQSGPISFTFVPYLGPGAAGDDADNDDDENDEGTDELDCGSSDRDTDHSSDSEDELESEELRIRLAICDLGHL